MQSRVKTGIFITVVKLEWRIGYSLYVFTHFG